MPNIAKLVLFCITLGSALPGGAQNYFTRPIRIVAPQAGGLSDLAARLMAPSLMASLGQPVVIQNQGGGNGAIAAQMVAKSAPDGHTLLFFGSNIWLLQFFQENVPWDTFKDFSPISIAVSTPNVLAVHPSLPVRSVKELIAIAKARPGDINYASSATGSGNHLAAELFKSMAAVNFLRVK